MMRGTKRCFRGVSLVELLVVTLILAIAGAIAIPIYESSRRNARLQACRANILAIHQAEEAYRVRNRTYTTSLETLAVPEYLGSHLTCPTGAEYDLKAGATGLARSITISCASRTTDSVSDKHSADPVYQWPIPAGQAKDFLTEGEP